MDVIDWLLDSDPAMRWQVMRDLTEAPEDLVGLDYLRAAGVIPDDRVTEAIDLVRSKRDADGRWPLENPHPGQLYFAIDDGEGQPS